MCLPTFIGLAIVNYVTGINIAIVTCASSKHTIKIKN